MTRTELPLYQTFINIIQKYQIESQSKLISFGKFNEIVLNNKLESQTTTATLATVKYLEKQERKIIRNILKAFIRAESTCSWSDISTERLNMVQWLKDRVRLLHPKMKDAGLTRICHDAIDTHD